MPVYKATLTITVMLEADTEQDASAAIDCSTLQDIGYEIDQGSWIGTVSYPVVVQMTGDTAISEALTQLGNDGTFFKTGDE